MLQLGSEGANVRLWGRFLRKHGFMTYGSADRFGAGLERGTKRFQEEAGTFGDGIVGPITTAAAKSDPYHFEGFEEEAGPSLADLAGIPPAVLQAVREVESGGDAKAVRFEPHIFLRLRPDLAGQIDYTPGRGVVWSTTGRETSRRAFERASLLDPDAAVRASSWGAFQVLGSHLLAGHDGGPLDAVEAFDNDPQGKSAALLARWFKSNPRARLAANRTPPDFEDLARCYNGPHFAKHGYDKRLRKAWTAARG
mgnify:FL=1